MTSSHTENNDNQDESGERDDKPKHRRWTVAEGLCALFTILIALYSLKLLNWPLMVTWLMLIAIMVIILVRLSVSIVGRGNGFLLNKYKKYDLSQFQLAFWTIIIFGAFAAAVFYNIRLGEAEPFNITIQSEIWIILGIDLTVLVGSPLIDNTKEDKPENVPLDRNDSPDEAEFSEMFRGDEDPAATTMDLGKVQMFYITCLLMFVYVLKLIQMFSEPTAVISALPTFDSSMIALLSISNTGFLVKKAIPQKQPSGIEEEHQEVIDELKESVAVEGVKDKDETGLKNVKKQIRKSRIPNPTKKDFEEYIKLIEQRRFTKAQSKLPNIKKNLPKFKARLK